MNGVGWLVPLVCRSEAFLIANINLLEVIILSVDYAFVEVRKFPRIRKRVNIYPLDIGKKRDEFIQKIRAYEASPSGNYDSPHYFLLKSSSNLTMSSSPR